MINKKRLLDNMLKYIEVNTQAVEGAGKIPSSPGQLVLAHIIAEDLKAAGVQDIVIEEQGYLFGTIPSNSEHSVPTIAYVSHLDTCSEAPGIDIKPRIVENYQGQTIEYANNKDLALNISDDEELKDCIGHTIITSDGTTILGSDDKAGIAEIIEMAHYFKDHPEVKHGKIRVSLMPDEEVTAGSENLDIKKLATDVAYTVDSFGCGALDIESFNGYKGKVCVTGNVTFPGYGKGIYLNASKVLGDFISKMTDDLWPQNSEGRKGLWWIDEVKGGVGGAEMLVYLRDFDIEGINEQKKRLEEIKNNLIIKYPKAKIDINISESYKNYRYELDKDKRVVEYAMESIKKIGVNPRLVSVRGGNDACHFCFHGLLSTNLFCGFRLLHSVKEWVSLEVMEKAAENIITLTKIWHDNSVKK